MYRTGGRGGGGKKRAKGVTKSNRAGIVFPVGRIKRKLKSQLPKFRFAAGAPVYLAAVSEYLTAEILELAGNAALDNRRRKRITPRHILFALSFDEDLSKLLHHVTLPSTGALPHVHPELLRSRKSPKRVAVTPTRKSRSAEAGSQQVSTTAVAASDGGKGNTKLQQQWYNISRITTGTHLIRLGGQLAKDNISQRYKSKQNVPTRHRFLCRDNI